VSWSLGADMKASPNDWVGFFKLGMPNEKYRDYIKTAGEREGSHSFTAPKTPGLYQFRYFREGTYNEVAHSDLIHIGPQLSIASALVGNNANGAKERIDVTFTLNSGELTTSDWFGLYNAEEKNNKNYLSMRYVQSSELALKKATFSFDAPRTPGDYVVRFFPSRCKYTNTATANTLRVLNRDKLTAELQFAERLPFNVRVDYDVRSVDLSSKDYVAIYKTSAQNNSYVTYAYIDPTKNSVNLAPPTEIDTYEIRFHSASQSKYADVCRSNSFIVPNNDLVSAEIASGILTVSWSIHSQPKSSWDWVGIFLKDSPNTKFVSYKYVDTTTNALVFEVPREHGVYEARYFSNALGKYVDFRKSREFHIA